jgi:hypothetical protein
MLTTHGWCPVSATVLHHRYLQHIVKYPWSKIKYNAKKKKNYTHNSSQKVGPSRHGSLRPFFQAGRTILQNHIWYIPVVVATIVPGIPATMPTILFITSSSSTFSKHVFSFPSHRIRLVWSRFCSWGWENVWSGGEVWSPAWCYILQTCQPGLDR